MSAHTKSEPAPITLDGVFKALQHWRGNKKDYDGPGIPDKIWGMIFQLMSHGYTKSDLCRLFGLNSEQFRKKHKQYHQPSSITQPPQSTSPPNEKERHIQLSEVNIKAPEQTPVPPLTQAAERNKQAVKTLKSNDQTHGATLDFTTVIVECFRADGARIKIHTVHDRVDQIITSFLKPTENNV